MGLPARLAFYGGVVASLGLLAVLVRAPRSAGCGPADPGVAASAAGVAAGGCLLRWPTVLLVGGGTVAVVGVAASVALALAP